MPVATLEKTPSLVEKVSLSPIANAVRFRVKLPAWSVLALLAMAASIGFAVGRQKPAHHYVSYFGYPLVLDTTTGKACYAVPPKPADSQGVQDTGYPVDGTANVIGTEPENGPAIPMCDKQ